MEKRGRFTMISRSLLFSSPSPGSGIEVFDCNGDGKTDVLVLKGADRPPWGPFSSKDKGSKPGLVFLNAGKRILLGKSLFRIPDFVGGVAGETGGRRGRSGLARGCKRFRKVGKLS